MKEYTLQLNMEKDADVIEYLNAQANKNDTIRRALRARMGDDYDPFLTENGCEAPLEVVDEKRHANVHPVFREILQGELFLEDVRRAL